MNSATDNRIITLLSDGGDAETGVRMLVEQYGERIYWHIRRLVVLHEDAQELTQDTFVRACFRIGSYRGEGLFLSWLYRIATNEALQWLRKRRPGGESIDLLRELPDREMDLSDETVNLFTEALLQLPPQQRSVFTLRYYDEMPYSQVAEVMRISESNAKTTYHYAMNKIRDYIKKHGNG